MAENDPGNTNSSGTGAAADPTNVDFIGSLPEDLRDNETLSGYEDLGGLAKDFVETKGKLSEQEQMIADLQGKVPQVPENPEGYQLKPPEGANPEEFNEFLKFAHETGMTPDQVSKITEYSTKQLQAEQQQKMDAEAKAIGELKTEWGDAFDANAQMAKSAVERFGGDELKQFLNESRLGNHPQLIKMFHRIATAISEDSLLTGTTNKSHRDRPTGIDGKPILSFPSMEKTQ